MIKQSTFCICGAKMVEGRIQQGVCKCNNLNCQRVLTGQICYYCPKGASVQQHRQGFFYCQQCALQLRRQNNQVIQAKPAMQVKTVSQVNAYPAQKPIAKKRGASIVKQGYMSKKGNWFNTAYKKRWFKLWTNKKMAYLTHPGASYTKGYADFTAIKKMEKKGKHGFEVTTSERVWSFLCSSEADRNSWFATIQSVCMGIQPQPVVKYVPAPQPQVQYVSAPPQPQPQVQYAQPALPNNGNVPQNPYVQPQPMYRGSVIQQPQNIPQQQPTRPQSQSLQPGMVGYNVGDMYGNNNNNNNLSQASAPSAPLNNNNNMNYNNNNNINNNNNNKQSWENEAPPPAYAIASAPPEDDIQPSAPPAEDQNEGAYTGQ